jgi:hypothetical protein
MVTSADNNIESSSTCGFTAANDQRDTDPELCLLDYYGGPTLTHALPATSAALDAGALANCPASDQRGLPRPDDGDGVGGAACDVGAFETQQVGGGCETVTPRSTNTRTSTRPTTPTPTPTNPTTTEPPGTPTPTGPSGTPTPTVPLPAGCPGDCDGSGAVSVDELVRGVNIALGRADVSTCLVLDRDGSGSVAVNELVTAVNSALRGCA